MVSKHAAYCVDGAVGSDAPSSVVAAIVGRESQFPEATVTSQRKYDGEGTIDDYESVRVLVVVDFSGFP